MARMPRLAVAAQVTVAAAILAAGWWAFQPGGYFRPISFPGSEADGHLPTDRPDRLKRFIRVPGGEANHPYFPEFGIVIDRAGRPGRVELLPANNPEEAPSRAMTDAAIAQIRTWRFVPFQAKGHPVHARFVAEFTLVPEEDRPSARVHFPAVADAAKVIMTYDENGIRRLPRSVTVHGDGQVETANTSIRSTQHFQATIPRETVLGLIDAFRRADFLSLNDLYGGDPSEGTARTVSITIDGQTKTVHDNEGQYGGLPDAVIEIEEALQRAGGLEP